MSALAKALCFFLSHRWDPNLPGHIKVCTRCGEKWDQCDWHLNEIGGVEHGLQFCSDCNCLLEQRKCDGCGLWFLDWDGVGSGDGVIGRPCSSKSGDIVCADCARDQDADDEEETDTDRHTDY
jgi:hypothetical protein